MVASQPVYSKVLAGHSPSGNMLINFTHTLVGQSYAIKVGVIDGDTHIYGNTYTYVLRG